MAKDPIKKAGAKKTAANKAVVKKSPAKKAAAKKAVVKKSPAKKAAAKKAVVKKSPAKKAAAKKGCCEEVTSKEGLPRNQMLAAMAVVVLTSLCLWTKWQKKQPPSRQEPHQQKN